MSDMSNMQYYIPSDKVLQAAMEHAAADLPRESCGLVVVFGGKDKYIPCHNIAETAESHFILDPLDLFEAEKQGDIVAVVHSHPDSQPIATMADKVSCEEWGYAWLIVNPRTLQHSMYYPEGYVAPLIGRQFCFGVLDCYTLVRDYYAETFDIHLRDYHRDEKFWEKGQQLYLDNFAKEGFIVIDDPNDLQVGDLLFMTLNNIAVANHAAIVLDGNMILHHPMNRISGKDIYGGYWKKITVKHVRHFSMIRK